MLKRGSGVGEAVVAVLKRSQVPPALLPFRPQLEHTLVVANGCSSLSRFTLLLRQLLQSFNVYAFRRPASCRLWSLQNFASRAPEQQRFAKHYAYGNRSKNTHRQRFHSDVSLAPGATLPLQNATAERQALRAAHSRTAHTSQGRSQPCRSRRHLTVTCRCIQ